MAVLVVVSAWFAFREPDFEGVRIETLSDLERELEALRLRLRIPGMSAAIAEGEHIVWARGFGLANRERGTAAGPDTIYHLASLTKPYGSTVLLQLVDEHRLDLDAPVSRFGIAIERSRPVKVWHLLSHTSGEPPGTGYRYDGNAFGALTQVIERTTGRLFVQELVDRIIGPLGLAETAPNPGDPQGFWSLLVSLTVSAEDVERGRAVFALSGLEREPIEAALAHGYARLGSLALANRSHWANASESSSLIVKIPGRQVTFVVLANSDGLSRWRRISDDADVTASPAATLFLNWYSSRRVEDRAVP
jgi:CubicO group peptidase (beta-lactamase class C family)